ncbi:hypothetical protein PENSPDRAFT_681092 [Peniophora sp. CONT]|nr:hypothetical protein PENSPDRAFT_681092 [Peniophora sp. CONT]
MQTPATAPPSSENVTKLMKKLFEDNHPKFGGKYAVASPSATMINPCLELNILDQWDVLGLPVSSTAIQALKQPLSVDISTKTPLEIDAARVRFLYPKWNTAVTKTAKSMFTALGLIGANPDAITVKLQGLYICPVGSRFKYTTTDDVNLLASLVYVLPTAHEGGSITARFGHESTVMSTSSESAYATSILCWCSNTIIEHDPITSGAQVLLRYDLLHTGPSPAPVIFDSTPAARDIAQALETWIKRRDEAECPQELYYIVSDEDTYGDTLIQFVTFQDLQGSDFVFINLVRELALKVGITVTLGQLKQTQHGTPYSPYQVKQDFYGSDEDDDVERYEDTAELREGDVDEVMWYFIPFLSEGKRGKEEELWEESEFEFMFDYEYLKGTAPDDVEWDGWQREDTSMTNLSYRLGLRLELPNPLKRKGLDATVEEAKIVELERKMRAFDEAAEGGSLL